MLVLRGGVVLTEFALAQLLEKAGAAFDPPGLSAVYYYFVDVENPLDYQQQRSLRSLLSDAELANCSDLDFQQGFLVVPRLGTISSWSSKATDIAHNCALSQIKRIERGVFYTVNGLEKSRMMAHCHDPLTESLLTQTNQLEDLFSQVPPKPLQTFDLLAGGLPELQRINTQLGLSLSEIECQHLLQLYAGLQRNPTAAELMMFAQVNSEHCRHKIFNALWTIDGVKRTKSLFSMIKNTQQQHPDNALVAYSDNAAVLVGHQANHFFPSGDTNLYQSTEMNYGIVLKVETHNHPTAIAPFPGAATGSGGEIRDEAATGRGGRAKAGLCGFSVSNLQIPNLPQPWECTIPTAPHLSSALDIMLQGPIGAASFNNEFGRPNLCGYFRTLLMPEFGSSDAAVNYSYRGYHKPIMIAGGIGQITADQTHKQVVPLGAPIVVLGGPAFAIGLGGGSASSRASSNSTESLDFASVQRSNPEMQRRAQEVINACWLRGAKDNPILSIHDVGAGGLSNALPEIIHDAQRGAVFQLRAVPLADPSLSPLEIWCNESQERYVLALDKQHLDWFEAVCQRERCPYAVLGYANDSGELVVADALHDQHAVDLPLSALFEKMPALACHSPLFSANAVEFNATDITLEEAALRVLQLPSVADKSFLITIGDRSVGGLVARDQMVGPWQVPVADVAVTMSDFTGYSGEAMAMGERPMIALIDPAASARMAVAEALTNITAARVDSLSSISLSANWMGAPLHGAEGDALYQAVEAIGMELCPALGISIPVGKDSLSMQTAWHSEDQRYQVTSPLSLVITAAGAVADVRDTLTPLLVDDEDTEIVFIDLAAGSAALGATALAQVYQQLGSRAADVRDVGFLKRFYTAMTELKQQQLLLAYHDRSDGGLFAALCEMMFAGHVGLTIDITALQPDPLACLFNEELGVVLQYKTVNAAQVNAVFSEYGLSDSVYVLGEINKQDQLEITQQGKVIYNESRIKLQRTWSATSFHLRSLRDNPASARQEYDLLLDDQNRGLTPALTFDLPALPVVNINTAKPKVAILREQGVNGQLEMAAAFYAAGFDVVDVHMQDLLAGKTLDEFQGLAACGGFSYGDVLGAGSGWAQTILHNAGLKNSFEQFFHRDNTFTLGVCNGCQMLSQLTTLIPGADHWPRFLLNESHQYEARLVQVRIEQSSSVLLQGMQGSVLPVVVSHGEGRAVYSDLAEASVAPMSYVDSDHQVTAKYPQNPNGSELSAAGAVSVDGRVTIMMPHPERVFRAEQLSWCPDGWAVSPWVQCFINAKNLFSG
jgi:phosphoribosylformylglycinamidine synthase